MIERAGVSRRTFLGATAATAAAAAALPVLNACSASTAARHQGSLEDVEHVVILMQENRSFDHYFGTMRGVRGYGDRAATRLSATRSVFQQPDPYRSDGGFLLPFHVDTATVDGQSLGALDHTWEGTHAAWNRGDYDGWVAAKTELTMGYFTEADVPFHRALAAAFTVCDNYFCSVQGPTIPNRLYLWSGMIDPTGASGGPVKGNSPDYKPIYDWTTYPERLQKAGISWQVFANDEVGDALVQPYLGDFGDNPLWLFRAYHDALNSPNARTRQLAERANVRTSWKPDSGLGKSVDHVLAPFISACQSDTLPAVSWVVAPYAYCEHPAARPVDGAAYANRVLDAVWVNPTLWEKTVVLVNYDENDGFFDHVPPPVAPAGTAAEYIGGRPIGLGPRVPLIVASPWSTGGYVNSQVFDHTSILQFLEAWTGVREENISAWRREICGDLLTCFDFGGNNTSIPTMPDTPALRRLADQSESKYPMPTPPGAGRQQAPVVEAGTAPARALPYQPLASLHSTTSGLTATLANHGAVAVQFAVYAYHLTDTPPQRIDVAPAAQVLASVAAFGAYDVAIHGPNGFLVQASGDGQTSGIEIAAELAGTKSHPTVILRASNATSAAVTITGAKAELHVPANDQVTLILDPLAQTSGWYDITLKLTEDPTWSRHFAGHLENGQPSRTG